MSEKLSDEEFREAVEEFKEKTGCDNAIIIGWGFGKFMMDPAFDMEDFEERAKAIGYLEKVKQRISGAEIADRVTKNLIEMAEELDEEGEEE